MAAIFTIVGGILGFASAMATLVIAQAGILFALGVWITVGVSFLGLGVLTALMPRPQPEPAKTAHRSLSA